MDEKKLVLEAVHQIDQIVDLFYQQKTGAALGKLDHTLVCISNAMDSLYRYKEKKADFVFNEDKLKASLNEALDSLQKKDYVLLADILQYDFGEYLKELASIM